MPNSIDKAFKIEKNSIFKENRVSSIVKIIYYIITKCLIIKKKILFDWFCNYIVYSNYIVTMSLKLGIFLWDELFFLYLFIFHIKVVIRDGIGSDLDRIFQNPYPILNKKLYIHIHIHILWIKKI